MAQRKAPGLMPLLLEAAVKGGARISFGAEELTGRLFNSEVLSEAISGTTIDRRSADLPDLVGCAELDGIPVLFGELVGPPLQSNVDAQMRKYRNQIAIARSWLGSDAPNLQLFFVGPPQSVTDSRWRQWAAEIEADDRGCRKLVWLFRANPLAEDAANFLERTFIARPWPTEQVDKQLDVMASVALPAGWESVIEEPALSFDELVDRLISLEGASA